MIRAVLFDVDGTLLNSRDYLFETFNLALEDIGEKRIDEKAFFGLVKKNMDNLLAYYVSDVLKRPEKETRITAAFIKHYLRMIESEMELLPGTDRTWDYLKRNGIKIGILTNQFRVMLDVFLNKFSLTPDACITREEVERKKPDGEGIRKLCEKLDVGVGDAIVVGDWTGDILAAKDAGARSVAVLTGVSRQADLEKAGADVIIPDITEIPAIIQRLN